MQHRSSRFLMIGVVAAASLAGCAGDADDGTLAYVGTLGVDTLFVEEYAVEGNRVQGKVLARQPYTHSLRYTGELDAAGHLVALGAEMVTPPENPNGPARMAWQTRVEGGTASVSVEGGQNPGSRMMEVERGALPSLGRTPIAMFVLEAAVRAATESGASEHPIQLITPTGPRPVSNAVTRQGPNRVSISSFGMPFIIDVGPDGRIERASGAETTFKVEVAPASSQLDFAALASNWASRDAQGMGFGVPSPGAAVAATIGGANLEVVYSQPARRGRDIWGGLVPYGEVWRTGANAATVFTTDRDLEIGGEPVPAGSYTLWSTYGPEAQALIVNSQTGQWGTMYDATRDFVRVPMQRSPAPEVSERFTIALEGTASGGALHFTWDDTRFTVPFTVR